MRQKRPGPLPEASCLLVAERGGFEPPDDANAVNGFRDRRFQPLSHLSAGQYSGWCEGGWEKPSGGEGGIRTPETAYRRLRDFQSRSLSQLGHLSAGRERPARADGKYSAGRGCGAGVRGGAAAVGCGRRYGVGEADAGAAPLDTKRMIVLPGVTCEPALGH